MKTSLQKFFHLTAGLLAIVAASLVFGHSAQAADGTWTNLAGGLWDTTTNWSGGIVANGSGFTANFNTLDISAGNKTVNLNSSHTIGTLLFGDTVTSTAGSWTLANNSTPANILTLAGGTPAITVNSLGTGATATVSAVIAGSSGLLKNGGGTLVLSAVNTYTGATAITGGNLTLSGSLDSSGSLALAAGTFNYAPTVGGSTQTFSGTTLNLGFATITNATSGNTVALGAITRNAGGILNLSSLTGTTTTKSFVSSGILGTWLTTGSGTGLTYASGGSPDGGTTEGAITAYTGGTAAATAANVTDTTGVVNYDVAAVGALGAGASVNTLRYTGAAGTITGNFSANGLMNAGTGTATYSGALTIGANKDLVVIGNTQATTLNGAISNNGGGASSVTYAGNGISASTGILNLAVGNSYSGGTYINSGALRASNGSALGSGAVNVASGAQLQISTVSIGNTINLSGGNSSIYTIGANGTATITGTINLLAGAGQTGTTGNNIGILYSSTSAINLNGFTYSINAPGASQSAQIDGTVNGGSTSGLTKGSGGNLTITGSQTSTFSGTFTLAQGGLLLGNDGALGSGTLNYNVSNDQSAVIRSSGGAGADRTIANVVTIGGNGNSRHGFGSAGGAKVTFSNTTAIALTATRKFDAYSTTEFAAAFTGAGGLSVNGANTGSPVITQALGTLILNGANTYTGTTTIAAGTLLVNTSHVAGAGTYSVGATGTLGGTGSITATSLTTAAGSKLTPGATGTLGNAFTFALSGGMNLSASSNDTGAYIFDLATTATSDKITLTLGTLNLGTLDFADFAFNPMGGFGVGTYVLFDAASAITGSIGTASGTIGGLTSTLSIDSLNNDVLLTVVPEPSTWALLAFSLMTVIVLRRRRA